MESATKNRKTARQLSEMVDRAFGDVGPLMLEELTEGFFNVAYLVALPDGKEAILKIAPPKDSLIMTHEKNIMRSEVDCMRLVARETDVPVANILFYDDSHSLCDVDYFFMSKLAGKSFSSASGDLDDTDKRHINHALGEQNAKINGIKGTKFGYFGQPDKQGTDWHSVFSDIVHDALADVEALNIDIGVKHETIERLLMEDKACFSEVETPALVHWDLWNGNVFIQGSKITGLIDFERCLWADPLMEFGFRAFSQNPDFLKGYGIAAFTEKQKQRIIWYDLYLYLISSLEYDYRKYPDDSTLRAARKNIGRTVSLILNR